MFRVSSFLVFYFGQGCDNVVVQEACVSNLALAVIFTLPYWFMFWIFSYLAAAWIILVHFASQTEPKFAPHRNKFIAVNAIDGDFEANGIIGLAPVEDDRNYIRNLFM